MAKRKRKRRTSRKPDPAGRQITFGLRELAAVVVVLLVVGVAGWWALGRDVSGFPNEQDAAGVPPTAAADAERPESADSESAFAESAVAESAVADNQPVASPIPNVMEPGTWVTPEGDPAFGSVSAPITIVEYSDYQCPNCREFAVDVVPWLRDTWVRRGFVRVVFRDFAILGDESIRAAEAAHCAGEQGRFWSYHEALFALQSGQNMGVFNDEALKGLAADIGLDDIAFSECLTSGRGRGRVDSSTQLAFGQGYEGTPTFIVNGRIVSGAVTTDRWDELFRAYEQDAGQSTQSAP